MCFSEPYLDSTISSNDNNLCLDGYKLVRADHPKKIKQVRVCIYYRETIPVIVIQINQLPECLACDYENRKTFIVTLCRSPSPTDGEFDEFFCSFDSIIDNIYQSNPYFGQITGDFNARSRRWWENDIKNNNFHISNEDLTSSYSLKQLISKSEFFTYFKFMY